MLQKFYYIENNCNFYTDIFSIITLIKHICFTKNKILGINYMSFSEIYNEGIEKLLTMDEYNNKCVIIQENDKWLLVEKKIRNVETGWLYSNIINEPFIEIIQTFYKLHNFTEEQNDISKIIENNDFNKLLLCEKINNTVLVAKDYNILFSKCENAYTIIHFINVLIDIKFIDENNKRIIDYVIENPSSISLDIFKYIMEIDNSVILEAENILHKLIMLYDKSFINKNIYEGLILYIIGQQNVKFDKCINNTWSIIHYICAFTSYDIIKFTLEVMDYMNKLELINIKTDTGLTPLHLICKYKYGIKEITLLLKYGADKYSVDIKGHTPFNYIPIGKIY